MVSSLPVTGPPYDQVVTSLARTERAALADLLDQLGPDEPTLCGDWTTRDLAAHLTVRALRPRPAEPLLAPRRRQVPQHHRVRRAPRGRPQGANGVAAARPPTPGAGHDLGGARGSRPSLLQRAGAQPRAPPRRPA